MGNCCTTDKKGLPFEPLAVPSEAQLPAGAKTSSTDAKSKDGVPGASSSGKILSSQECKETSSQAATKSSKFPGLEGDSLNEKEDGEEIVSEGTDDVLSPLAEQAASQPNYRASRRGSVSAEGAAQMASAQQAIALPRKDPATEQVIMKAMAHCFLFSDLGHEQKVGCVSSMFQKDVTPGQVLIRGEKLKVGSHMDLLSALVTARQGEEGDNFYVISEGVFTARIAQSGESEKVVYTYDGKGAFGELALMYNCPRAATVQAESSGHVWGMDRASFRRIILASCIEKREKFDETLRSMEIFKRLNASQRSSIADCLHLEVFEEGEVILSEGDEITDLSKFYVIEDGSVICYRTYFGEKILVKELNKGEFFGEVALVTKADTRVADCIARTRCELLTMSKDAFERLMGPAEAILLKEVKEYEALNRSIQDASGATNQAEQIKQATKAVKQHEACKTKTSPTKREVSTKKEVPSKIDMSPPAALNKPVSNSKTSYSAAYTMSQFTSSHKSN